MYANYHTHTYLCKHASGVPDEYVENAVRNGVKVLGFSDHVPYPFSDPEHHSCFRMELEETAEYVRMITGLREKYRGQIEILIGYEAEYYPKEFSAMLEHIKQFECDYLILGQHCYNNEYDGGGTGWQTEDESLLRLYTDQVIAGINTGKFSYIAHPDLINFTGDGELYASEMTRLCLEAKRLGLPLEINMLGLEEGRHYPKDDFWRIAAQVGCDVILGCDAHRPDAAGHRENEQAALAYAARLGLKPITELRLRRP